MKDELRSFLDAVEWTTAIDHLRCFANLNCSYRFGLRNIEPPATSHFASQVHGIQIVWASSGTQSATSSRVEADGVATTQRDTVVATRTADCLPLLFFGAKQPVVAAVHAGWRGLFAGVVQQSLRFLSKPATGNAAADLRVAIGPSISSANFEVGPEVVTALQDGPAKLSAEELNLCLTKGRADRWHIDLAMVATLILRQSGILPAHISVVRRCTFANTDLASYRRDGAGAGRNWSYINLG